MAKNTAPKSRGAVSKKGSRLITVWIPMELVAAADRAVRRRDTDRSKWIREAIREKSARDGEWRDA